MGTARSLIDHPLLRNAPREAAAAILDRFVARERSFTQGQVVAIQGDPLDQLSVIAEGRLAATMESPAGRSLMVETLAAPEILAPGMLLGPDARLPVTLTALSDGRIVSVSLEALHALGGRFPSVYRNLLHMGAEKFAFVATKMRLLHFATLRQKTAGYLLELLGRTAGTTVTLPYTRERLAELFGVARPSLSRVLGELVEEGVIDVARERVLVTDARSLAAVLREDR